MLRTGGHGPGPLCARLRPGEVPARGPTCCSSPGFHPDRLHGITPPCGQMPTQSRCGRAHGLPHRTASQPVPRCHCRQVETQPPVCSPCTLPSFAVRATLPPQKPPGRGRGHEEREAPGDKADGTACLSGLLSSCDSEVILVRATAPRKEDAA